MKGESRKLKILVSSTVYGIEELLERVYTLLTLFGYEVWMSHKGTVPVFPSRTAFENCLQAVEDCDLFFGIITPSYGSGQDPKDPTSLSITHQEILKAIELNKPRWLLAHENVVFARTMLNNLGCKGKTGRAKLILKKNQVFQICASSISMKKLPSIMKHLKLFPWQNDEVIGSKNFVPTTMAQFS